MRYYNFFSRRLQPTVRLTRGSRQRNNYTSAQLGLLPGNAEERCIGSAAQGHPTEPWCHGAQARWYRGSYDVLLHRFYTKESVLNSDTKMLLPSASLG